jgi:hypothetical protein
LLCGVRRSGPARQSGAGVDIDILAGHLQRQGAGAFGANWATLLDAITEKAGTLKTKTNP